MRTYGNFGLFMGSNFKFMVSCENLVVIYGNLWKLLGTNLTIRKLMGACLFVGTSFKFMGTYWQLWDPIRYLSFELVSQYKN